MIEFHNITKVFKSDLFVKAFTALDDVSFRLDEGKITGFLGANGAGKTTSLKILMDFIRPSSGTIHFSETLGKKKKEIFSNIGFLPERAYYYPDLTGFDFCYYMGSLSKLSKKQVDEQIKNWAPKFKIDFALERKLRTYSKGMLQRVGFLVSLIHNPKLVILDEPLSGLDPLGRKELKDIIKYINNEGRSVFFSSHILSDVEEICDDILFLKNGKLDYQGSVSQILKKHHSHLYEIQFSQNENISSEIVDAQNKEQRITELLEKGAKIRLVSPKKQSLEEIFYEV